MGAEGDQLVELLNLSSKLGVELCARSSWTLSTLKVVSVDTYYLRSGLARRLKPRATGYEADLRRLRQAA